MSAKGAPIKMKENNPRYPAAMAHPDRPTGNNIRKPAFCPMGTGGWDQDGGLGSGGGDCGSSIKKWSLITGFLPSSQFEISQIVDLKKLKKDEEQSDWN